MIRTFVATVCALSIGAGLCGCHGPLKRKIRHKHHIHHGPDVKIKAGPGKIKLKP